MHHSGIERAVSIHRALGFDQYDAKNATKAEGAPEYNHIELVQRREALRNSLSEQYVINTLHSSFPSSLAENPPLIVMSESNARGLDFYFDVVFLWELPREVASYVHMAGRTGRLGRKGKVVSLVSKELKKRVGLFESHLGVRFKYLTDPEALHPEEEDEDQNDDASLPRQRRGGREDEEERRRESGRGRGREEEGERKRERGRRREEEGERGGKEEDARRKKEEGGEAGGRWSDEHNMKAMLCASKRSDNKCRIKIRFLSRYKHATMMKAEKCQSMSWLDV
eukprot:767944-Hanusia_phi.AAC.2